MTVHQLQYGVASALQRNMEMRHEPMGTGYEFNNLVGQQVGLDGRDTITFDTFDLV